MEKTYMFQYAYIPYSVKIVEDTGLITKKEAEELWDKYYSNCLDNLKDNERPQMCIWQECNSITDYSSILKEIDYGDDYEIKNGDYYRVIKLKTLVK